MSDIPIAVRLGLTHVTVIHNGSGWCAALWSPNSGGQRQLGLASDYERAIDQARAYAAIDPDKRILPDGLGELDGRALVHVEQRYGDKLEVLHESSSGNSFAMLRLYNIADRKPATLFAVDGLPQYGNSRGASRLGRVSV
jgi:hypothetical protein